LQARRDPVGKHVVWHDGRHNRRGVKEAVLENVAADLFAQPADTTAS